MKGATIGKCRKKRCMFRDRSGVCDFILITGRPRGCDIENCTQYVPGPKAKARSEWVGKEDHYGERKRY